MIENATATYSLTLNVQPTGNVTITPSSSDTALATVSAPLVFTQANWTTSQSVMVSGVDNPISNADVSLNLTHTIAGGNYDNTLIANVALSVTDNDTIGIRASNISSVTTETYRTATFTLVLDTQPTAAV
ncbi:Alkaline phosphatase [uncultured Candidatus Thioglobus sp.]|nr:Alkaline phosphatase [uncultured Candidatus Thioglobus sp.]